MELPGAALDSVPDLASNRGSALGADKVINAGLELTERVLDMGALSETSPEEGGVECDQDPRAALEDDGAAEQANPQEDLQPRHDRHGRIIVLLDEGTNRLGERVLSILRLGAGRGSGRRVDLLGRDKGWDYVCARVGRDVENRVDAIWQHRKRVLGHEEPDDGHHWVGQPKHTSQNPEMERRTEVLDVLIGEVAQGAGLLSASLLTGTECLVDDNPVCCCGRQKAKAIANLGDTSIVVEADPRERVAEDAEK